MSDCHSDPPPPTSETYLLDAALLSLTLVRVKQKHQLLLYQLPLLWISSREWRGRPRSLLAAPALALLQWSTHGTVGAVAALPVGDDLAR